MLAGALAKAGYFFFFDPDGKTLATALTIEPATFATTPFLELRFFALGFVFDFVRAFGAVLDFDFFFAAVFAITDTPTFSSIQKILNLFEARTVRLFLITNNSASRAALIPDRELRAVHPAYHRLHGDIAKPRVQPKERHVPAFMWRKRPLLTSGL